MPARGRPSAFSSPAGERISRARGCWPGPAAVGVLVAGAAFPAAGQTVTWNSPTVGDWFDGGNWSGGNVPTAANPVVVGNGQATISGATGVSEDGLLSPGGIVSVSGALSRWETGPLYFEGGTLSVDGGGGVLAGTVFLDQGVIEVTGSGSQLDATGALVAGRASGPTTITVAAGGQLESGGTFLGEGQATLATSLSATVTGADSIWSTDYFSIGGTDTMETSLTITAGGTMRAITLGAIGVGGLSAVTVSGANSHLDLGTGELQLGVIYGGADGHGRLTVESGGRVSADTFFVGSNGAASSGMLTLAGAPGARGIVEVNVLQAGQGIAAVSFDGGILRARRDESGFISGFDDGSLAIGPGNLLLDSNGFVVGTDNALTGVGALEKVGAGTLVLTGDNTYAGGTLVEAGTLQLGDGGTQGSILGDVALDGVLAFNRSDSVSFGGGLFGTGGVHQIGAGTTVLGGDGSALSGTSQVHTGILSVDAVLGGTMEVLGGRLQGTGSVGATTNFAAGTIAPGNSIGTLTIMGDYHGNGGTLEIEAVLGDDTSPTDLLVIEGSTTGSTNVQVINLGGSGGSTVEGIRIIEVGGASAGDFTLLGSYVFEGDEAVVSGAYAYRLYRGGASTPGDGDWYLRSSLIDPGDPAPVPSNPGDPSLPGPGTPLYQPGAPIYEVHGSILQALNGLDTLQQRVGNRYWAGNDGDASAATSAGTGLWGRITGFRSSIGLAASATGASYAAEGWQVEAGADGALHQGAAGTLIGGVSVRHGTVSAAVTSVFGDGSIASVGTGVAGSMTWYGTSGTYLDGQAAVTWYDSTLFSTTAATPLASGNRGIGHALSLEAGQQVAIAPNWSVTPQIQLGYSAIDRDGFSDVFGSEVSPGETQNLRGRLGISVDYEAPLGNDGRLHAYGVANLHRHFVQRSEVDLAGVMLDGTSTPTWAGLGVGGTIEWAEGRYRLHGEARIDASIEAIPSYSLTGDFGLAVRF